jgi:hypothetical protein
MHLLPTKSPRKYRGKHPDHIHSWSYGRSPSTVAVEMHLGITKPVWIELRCGIRYIVPLGAFKSGYKEGPKLGVDFYETLKNRNEPVFVMTQATYDEMLQLVRKARGQ